MINVGVDATGYRPIGETALATLINASPASHSTADQQAPRRDQG